MTDAEMIGLRVKTPGGVCEILACAQALDMAFVVSLDEAGNRTRKHGILKPSEFEVEFPDDAIFTTTDEENNHGDGSRPRIQGE